MIICVKDMIKISIITSLYNCSEFLPGYFKAVDEIVNKHECEFLLLHNAPKQDEINIIEKYIKNKPWFHHIIIKERESLYTTWNRGIKMSQGEFCAVWNVDDIREPESLLFQKLALENNPNSDIAFGDIWGTKIYGKIKHKLYFHPTWSEDKKAFMYRHMIGCFPFWRKSVHNKIHFFEEQLKLVADLDFQIRVARISSFEKVIEPSGYYLEDSSTKLSSNSKLQTIERNVVNLRYGNFNLLNLVFIYPAIKNYRIFYIKNSDIEFCIRDVFPGFRIYWFLRLPLLLLSILSLPKDFMRVIYHRYYK